MGNAAGVVKLALVGGFVTFGVWSAIPSLMEVRPLAPLSLPTALPQPSVASTPLRATDGTVISLTDRDLTQAAEPYFPQTYGGITVTSPSVRVTSGRVVLSAAARSFLANGPLVATATPTASAGRLLVRVDSVTLGGVALPEGMRAQIGQQLQSAIDAQVGARLQVDQVTTAAGLLTVKGLTSP